MKSYLNPKTLECRFEEMSEGEGESVKGFGDGSEMRRHVKLQQ